MAETNKAVSLHGMLADLWRSFRDASGRYRPERHYMRGPGPKWRERHGIPDQANPPWRLSSDSPAELALAPTCSELR
jgi:hypothetical protein